MKFFCLVGFLALSLGAAWPLAAVQAEPLILENQTGRPVCEAYLAPAGSNNWTTGWGGDGHCLAPGRKWRLRWETSAPAGQLQDLRLIFEDGLDRTYFGLDLGLYTYVILGDLEAELYEWDPAGSRDK